MNRRAAAAVVVGLAAVGSGAAWLLLRDRGAPSTGIGAAAGTSLGRPAATAVTAGWATPRLPVRCLDLTGAPQVHGTAGLGPVRLGIVADARGATAARLASIASVRAELARAGVVAILVLGGTGETREDIQAVLAALASPGTLLVSMPGDREPVLAHAQAVAALAAQGLPVVDGAHSPLLVIHGVAIGLLPGVAAGADGRAHGQVAGADGCARLDEDADALAARLAALPAPRVLVSHAPPRQRALDATDMAQGGVHMGDPAVARAARAAGVVAVAHGLIDETAGRSVRDGDLVVAAAGPLEAGSALVLEVTGRAVTFKRIP